MTCTWIARFQVSELESINSQLNSPLVLSSSTVTGEIDREALPKVELKLNRFWNLGLTGPAEPSALMVNTIPSLNFMKPPRPKPGVRLYLQFSVTGDVSFTGSMPGDSFSSGFDDVLIGVGSNHVTIPLSEGEYFRSKLYYNNSCFPFHPTRKSFPKILN